MSEIYKRTTLWRKSLGSLEEPYATSIERLRVAYLQFREKAAQLTDQIHKSLPNLTVHGLTHLDALWETADLIAGPDYPLNPMEGFVLGGPFCYMTRRFALKPMKRASTVFASV